MSDHSNARHGLQRPFECVEAFLGSEPGVDQQIALVEFDQVDVYRFQLPRHGKRDRENTRRRVGHATASAA